MAMLNNQRVPNSNGKFRQFQCNFNERIRDSDRSSDKPHIFGFCKDSLGTFTHCSQLVHPLVYAMWDYVSFSFSPVKMSKDFIRAATHGKNGRSTTVIQPTKSMYDQIYLGEGHHTKFNRRSLQLIGLWSHGMSWLGFSRVRVNTLIFRERTELQGHQVVCCGWIGWALYPQFDAFIMICLMCLMFFPSWLCHLGVKQISEMPTFWVNYHHKSFTNLKCWAILGMLPRILTMFIVRENSEVVVIYPDYIRLSINIHYIP